MVEAVRNTLADPALDQAFVAEAVLLPTESFIGDQMKVVDPEAIHHGARGAATADSARSWSRNGAAAYAATAANRFEYVAGAPRARGGCARSRSAI